MERYDWVELPAAARTAVEARTGPVASAVPVPDGITCRMAAVLSASSGRLFVKGVPMSDAAGCAGQAWEVAVSACVRGVSPALRWRVTSGGWDLLGFEYVDCRHADLSPGSADVSKVAEVLLAREAAQASLELGVPLLADRFAAVLTPQERELLHGDALLHTDTNPHNLLVTGDRAFLVDWAMPARGPAWVDVAYTTVRLMEADTPPDEALKWASQFPSWRAADPRAVEVFVAGTCRAWDERVGTRAARPSNARFAVLLDGC
ncbi:phosphotransferase [Streptomyces luteocolor]|uniref:phosphotransferase n=1 Tax=Streptomyces luteocolor TaxID=285500 RepID=UPI000A8017A3|nr:phosphotransferase [Streptomyces luteocolor]